MSAFQDALSSEIQRRPALLQLATGLARRISPVWVFGHTVVSLGSDAVREVFDRADEFELGPVAHHKMLLGPFLLGMDPRQQYLDERKLLGEVLERLQPRLEEIAREKANEAHARLEENIERHRGATIEVVSEFTEPVVTGIASVFFGVPFPDTQRGRFVSGTGERLLTAWLRKVGSVISSTSPAPFGLQRVAECCAIELGHYLDAVIAARRESGERKADVLGHLLELETAQGWHPWRVRANLPGLMPAGSTALVKSFALALHQLFVKRPPDRRSRYWRSRHEEAIAAAKRGALDELKALMFEALRFETPFPILVRYCPRATTLGQGERARKVPAGSTVYAVQVAAVFDELVEDADTLRQPRPPRPHPPLPS